MRLRASSLIVLVVASTPLVIQASPLPARDQNPLLAGYSIPAVMPAALPAEEGWAVDTTFSWGSTAVIQASDTESLTVDAETRELRIALLRALPNGLAIGIEVPWRQTTGGSLDGFIDDWHDAFGLPEGDRPSLPQDALRITYRRDGTTRVDLREASSGLGDVSFNLGKQWVSNERTHVATWLGLKLPTGDADDFTGSGSVDLSALLSAERKIGTRLSVFGQIGGARLGDGDRLPGRQRNWLASAGVGASARVFDALTLTVQFDTHTAVYEDVDVELLGDAGILSIGATITLGNRYELALSVSEDVFVESAPDVVFLVGLKAVF